MIGLIGAGVGAIGGILGHSAKKKQERRRIRAKRKRAKHAYSQSVENGRLTNMFLETASEAQVLDMARNDKNASQDIADQVAEAKGTSSANRARGVGAGKTMDRVDASIMAKGIKAKHAQDAQSRSMINQLNDKRSGTANNTQMANINKYNEMTTALADKGWVNGSYLTSALSGAMQGYSLGQHIEGMMTKVTPTTKGDIATETQIRADELAKYDFMKYRTEESKRNVFDATNNPVVPDTPQALRVVGNRQVGANY